jgi:hypothetical protein
MTYGNFTNVTCEVTELHSIQYNSFGKLKTPDDGWWAETCCEKRVKEKK